MSVKFGAMGLAVMLLAATSLKAADVNDCINNSDKSDDAYSRCWLEEAKRLTAEIKDKYEILTKNKLANEWNKGNGMFKGNLKDTFDSWVAYRNRFCSLYGVAGNQETGETKAFHQAMCLVDQSKNHNAQLGALITTFSTQMINDGGDL